jgi:hypothetical protein
MGMNTLPTRSSGNPGIECVNDVVFLEAVLGRATTWPDAIERRINISEARERGKLAFDQVPIPSSLDHSDIEGTRRREYEVSISGNEDVNVIGNVTSRHYDISVHHNRGGFIVTRDDLPVYGARFVMLQRLKGDGNGYTYLLGYDFSTEDPESHEPLSCGFQAKIDDGGLVPEDSSCYGDQKIINVATSLQVFSVMNKCIQYITPPLLPEQSN